MFLAARSPLPEGTAKATLIGAPNDRTASFRRGARFGPAAIRWASQSIESYSPLLDRDLEEVALLDLGELDVERLEGPPLRDTVARAVAAATGLPVLLGGEHTVTVGAVAALADRHPDLQVLVLDAHLDLRPEHGGTPWSHACTVRRLLDRLDPQRVAVLGVRSGTREEYAAAASLAAAAPGLTLAPDLWRRLEGRPLYLSIDIDVVDPAFAPGVGNPEPGGATATELLDLLRIIAPLQVVGLDVTEVAPSYDPSGRTATLAAVVVREAVLTWAGAPGRESPL